MKPDTGEKTRFMRMAAWLLLMLISAGGYAGGKSEYEKGETAARAGNYAQARAHWMPLAMAGDMHAQYQIGRFYEKGQGVDKDLETAMSWYSKAAKAGHADSQYRVAVAYAYGVGGVDKDEAKAVEWLTKAGEGGNKRSQRLLARIYETGELNVTPDARKARYWSDKAGPKR